MHHSDTVGNGHRVKTRKCSKCGSEKPLTAEFFHEHPKCSDGFNTVCKECRKAWRKEHYHKNSDKYKAESLSYYYEHREEVMARSRTPRARLQQTATRLRRKAKINAYNRKMVKSSPQFAISRRLRSRIRKVLRSRGATKSASTKELTGCSAMELVRHIELQFSDGMTWGNRPEWHVDHIIPCNAFDLTNSEEQQVCFHYTNLRPLWAHDNQTKHTKLLWD